MNHAEPTLRVTIRYIYMQNTLQIKLFFAFFLSCSLLAEFVVIVLANRGTRNISGTTWSQTQEPMSAATAIHSPRKPVS